MVILALGMHFGLDWENQRRDGLYGRADADAQVDVTDDGDGHRHFRYIT